MRFAYIVGMNAFELKQQLYQHCSAVLNERIATIVKRIADLKEAKANETKSSAGDKFETGRAMLQNEEQKARQQLTEANTVLKVLGKLPPTLTPEVIGPGSLVTTDKGVYYILVGVGKVPYEGKTYYCVSAGSPVAQAMAGKKAGDTWEINGRKGKIVSIA